IVGEVRHLHEEFGGKYYLLSYTRRPGVDGKDYFIVLSADLYYVVGELFPNAFQQVEQRRLYQVVDPQGRLVYGHPFTGIPDRFVAELALGELSQWKLRMAPLEAPPLQVGDRKRRAFDLVLMGLSVATVFVGLGILSYAVRAERRASALKS